MFPGISVFFIASSSFTFFKVLFVLFYSVLTSRYSASSWYVAFPFKVLYEIYQSCFDSVLYKLPKGMLFFF